MKIIETEKIIPDDLKGNERDWCYNGLDACITSEVLSILLPQLDDHTQSTYSFAKALQGPVLEMRLRGILVDQARKAEVIEDYYQKLDKLERNLSRIVGEGLGFWGFNWRSNPDLHALFYDKLQIPVIRRQGRPTVNRDALEKMEAYTVAKPIINHMKALRDLGKRISVLKAEIDKDGRFRSSYNIAGTSTGRFSSSMSEFGTGGNSQNIEEGLRSIFIADKGMKMAYLDAEQIQSRIVGAIEWNVFHMGKYLDACESGDLHTTVAKMCWPNMPWSGDLAEDKALAEQPYYRHHGMRFMTKKLGHGTNFNGQPPEMAQQCRIDIDIVKEFRSAYFTAFPAHGMWHAWVREQIRSIGQLTSICGRRRYFFGRRDAEDTVREALAYVPQADESHIVNAGMLQVWRNRDCELLMQNHDAIVIQYPEGREDEIIPRILKQLRYDVQLKHGRVLTIPYGCKTGWNFGVYHSESNPDGLKEYKAKDERRRSPTVPILDRKFHRVLEQS